LFIENRYFLKQSINYFTISAMCFTISIKTTRDAIEKRFNVDAPELKDFDFRYFYKAFEQPVIPVITQQNPGEVRLMQWGLIPAWTRDMRQASKIRNGTYNARAESLDEKPSFRKAAAGQRCLVPVSGFYEWQHVSGQKIPWYIQEKNNQLFALAGIYDLWTDPESNQEWQTFSIVTTRANSLMEKIHNSKKRMPVILDSENDSGWLSSDIGSQEKERILRPYNATAMRAYTIGKSISGAGGDPNDPDIIKPVDYHLDGTLF
jgi:putative SOS response-associated peptidase YedK